MAWTRIQSKLGVDGSGASTDTKIVLAFDAAVSSRSLVVGYAYFDGGGGQQFSTISDDQGNTYTLVATTNNSNNRRTAIFYKEGITNGPLTITVNLTGVACGSRRMALAEYAGIAITSAIDGNAAQWQTDPLTVTDGIKSGSITTTGTGDLIFGGNVKDNAGGSVAGTGFTAVTTPTGGADNIDMIIEELRQTNRAPINATFTTTANDWSMCSVAAFKIDPPVYSFNVTQNTSIPNTRMMGY